MKSGPGDSICGFTCPTSMISPARISTRCIKFIGLKTAVTDRHTDNVESHEDFVSNVDLIISDILYQTLLDLKS